jgi:hypothetical protein
MSLDITLDRKIYLVGSQEQSQWPYLSPESIVQLHTSKLLSADTLTDAVRLARKRLPPESKQR